MSKEISNTLFRMVNMRNPKKVKDSDKDKHFVIRPESAKGVFDAHLQSNTENLTNWQKLITYCPTFNLSDNKLSVEQIKAENQSLYEFGVWIARNSENLNLENLAAKRAEMVENLTIDLVKIWDNFIYQVITQENFDAKEALMHLLKGNHVYNAFNNTTDPLLKQKADEQNNMIFKCKVVFPNLFDIREFDSNLDSRVKRTQKSIPNKVVTEKGKQAADYSIAQTRLKEFTFLKEELEAYHQDFKKKYDKAYQKAKKVYDDENKPIIDQYKLDVEKAKNTWCENRPSSEYNSQDPCQQPPTVPYPSLPDFEFDFNPDLTNKNLSQNLSDNALSTLYFLLKDSTVAKRKLKIDEKNIEELFKDIETFEDLFDIINKSLERVEKIEPVETIVEKSSRQLVEIDGVFLPVQMRSTTHLNFNLNFITLTRIDDIISPIHDVGDSNSDPIGNLTNPIVRIDFIITDVIDGFSLDAQSTFQASFNNNTSWQSQNLIFNENNRFSNIYFSQFFRLSDFNQLNAFSGQIVFQNGQTSSFSIQNPLTINDGTLPINLDLGNNNSSYILNVIGISSDAVTLTWSNVNEELLVGYKIQYQEIGESSWIDVNNPSTNPFILTGLLPSKSYRAQVRCIWDNGSSTVMHNVVTFITSVNNSGQVPTPANLVASTITQTSCRLDWTGSVGATSYDVYRNNVFLLNVLTNSSDVFGLNPATDYTFFVVARNIAGASSNQSNIVPVKTLRGSSDGTTPTTPADTAFIPSGFGIKQLGIADYDKVEQSTYCYIEGDVAHIENIMAREFREKTTRRLRQTTVEQSETFESEREQLTDTTSVDRFEMQSEVAKVIAQSRDMQANAYVNATFTPGPTIQTGAAVNYATHNSSEISTRQAITQAKEITERAMDRVVTKVKKERVEKILDEFEETNSHGFDNRKGDQHVVGVYRWVDKIMKNQIYTFGKRQMMEFMIPEPARLHALAMQEAVSRGNKIIEPPLDPRSAQQYNMTSYTNVSETTLAYWASKYNVELPNKKTENIRVGKEFSFSEKYQKDGQRMYNAEGSIEIPEGYISTYTHFNSIAIRAWGTYGSHTLINVGYKSLEFTYGSNYTHGELTGYVNSVPVSISTISNHIGVFNVMIDCQLTPEAKTHYQMECFNAIIKAYEEAKQNYEEQLKMAEEKAVQIKGSNPGFYRQIENTVLRQNCIAYMVEQNPNALLTLGSKGFIKSINPSDNKVTHENFGVNQTADLDKYTSFVKFFEQAFEWDIMSYYFYPYYWGGREQWADTYTFEDNDPLFRSFMQSGMARVIVTVRPGFEDAVSFYMKTGLIWLGGEVPTIGDDLYMSLAEEMIKPLGTKKGKPWRQRLPTPLTILQAESIGLKVEKALPCIGCDDDETYEDNLGDFCGEGNEYGFLPTTAQIGGVNTTTKGKIALLLKGLNEADSLKVVLRNLQNQVVKMTYLYGDGGHTFTDVPTGDYDLNFDEEDILTDRYDVTAGLVKQVVTISEESETIISLTVKPTYLPNP